MIQFKLLEFNTRRKLRGGEALRVEVTDEEGSYWLWMSKKDLRQNIKNLGAYPELLRGLECYRQNRLVDAPTDDKSAN
jgi:hypothetical protein